MAEHPLVLSDEEQQYLITHLKSALEETRVESHHTRTSAYREQVRREDSDSRSAIKSLCDKGLQKPDFANPVHLDKRQQRVAISDSVKSCDSRRSPGCSV